MSINSIHLCTGFYFESRHFLRVSHSVYVDRVNFLSPPQLKCPVGVTAVRNVLSGCV